MSSRQRNTVGLDSQRAPSTRRLTNVTRLVVIVGTFVLIGIAAIYDFAIARTGVAAADRKINELVEARSRLTAMDGGHITATDIQQALGCQPTWTDKRPDDGYEVEYYCWWGHVPILNLRRHYLAIVYEGDGSQRVFSSHHRNQRPPREALPMPYLEKQPFVLAADDSSLPLKDRPHLRRPVAAVWVEHEKLLAVANERSGSVSIVDFATRKVVEEIVIGERVADLAADPQGRWFYAVDPQTNELILLERSKDSLIVAKRHSVSGYPVAAAVSPNGDRISVVSLWSRKLTILDVSDAHEISQWAVIALPFNPREHQFAGKDLVLVNDAFARRSCEVDVTTHAIKIRDSRIVDISNPSRRLVKGLDARTEIRNREERIVSSNFVISLGPATALTPEERGEELFYSHKLSPTGQSCHDCHAYGHTTYELADTLADGSTGTPKRILTLLGTNQTYPWAWNGSLNELDDQVRRSLETTLHVRNVTPQQVVDINAFLHALSPPPPLEPSTDAPEDYSQLLRGQLLFRELGCAKCHIPEFTYTSGEVFDVGLSDEKGLSKFNPPSLLGVSQGYSFFHDGRAKTLAEVFTTYGHPLSRELSSSDLADLLRFLRSL